MGTSTYKSYTPLSSLTDKAIFTLYKGCQPTTQPFRGSSSLLGHIH